MKKNLSKLSPTAFKLEIYSKLPLNDLILSSIYLIVSKGETCTFERLVAECFNNFPKVFSFKRYPEWPDALKFDRPLRTLREKGFIVGSARDKFSLNKYGEIKARDILKKLKKGMAPKSGRFLQSPIRSADDRIIEFIKNSASFAGYLKNPRNFSISDQEFRNLLRCTEETPDRVIKQNLEYYLKVAKEYNETKIARFLLFCKRKYFKGGIYAKGSSY
ncbi:MAG: hypothetical protein ACPLYX_11340 [Rectinema subterraneum]|uniref:hypothetical protein n=1 Tax=Rectinema subterraneum TaxID=2653714 RepID=UPI003C7A4490